MVVDAPETASNAPSVATAPMMRRKTIVASGVTARTVEQASRVSGTAWRIAAKKRERIRIFMTVVISGRRAYRNLRCDDPSVSLRLGQCSFKFQLCRDIAVEITRRHLKFGEAED